MSAFKVERSIIINKPAEELYTAVADFNTWASWSPWLSQEPDCPVEITGEPGVVGHKQAWDGNKIGSGSVVLAEIAPHQALVYTLAFIKPWKSNSMAGFTFAPEAGGTKVTWVMEGSVPALMSFMKNKISQQVGADYEKGLALLKARMEG